MELSKFLILIELIKSINLRYKFAITKRQSFGNVRRS